MTSLSLGFARKGSIGSDLLCGASRCAILSALRFKDPWAEVVQPAMKFAVLKSLEAAQNSAIRSESQLGITQS